MKYSKQFIILKQDRLGYSFKGKDPSGRAIIEVSNSEVKLHISVQDLRSENLYKAFLIKSGDDKSVGVLAGNICPDSFGRYEMRVTTSADDIFNSGMSIDDIDVFAIMANDSDEIVVPLSGYKGDMVRWKNNFINHMLVADKEIKALSAEKEVEIPEAEVEISNAEVEMPKAEIEIPEAEIESVEAEQFAKDDNEVNILSAPAEVELSETEIELAEAEPFAEIELMEAEPFAEDDNEVNTLNAEADVEISQTEAESVRAESFAEAIIEEDSETAGEENQDPLDCSDAADEQSDEYELNDPEIAYAFQSAEPENFPEEIQTDTEPWAAYETVSIPCEENGRPEISEEFSVQTLEDDSVEYDSKPFAEQDSAPFEVLPSGQAADFSQIEAEEVIQESADTAEEAEIEMVSLSTAADVAETYIELPFDDDENSDANNYVKPFERQNKEVNWVEIGKNELSSLEAEFGKVLGNAFILACLNRHGHLILGKVNTEREEYYLGAPDIYNHDCRTTAYRLGFSQFKTAKDVPVKNGEFGYWLMAVTVVK